MKIYVQYQNKKYLDMEYYIGTSGWMYSWNPDGLDWYIKYTGLNTVELNSSFYRFPYPNQVKSWVRKTVNKDFRWSIKVHMSITHRRYLSSSSYNIWDRFRDLFRPLENKIHFYLLQLPPKYIKNEKNIKRLNEFIRHVELGYKLAIEFRHPSWFNRETIDLASKREFTFVSIDSPETYFIDASGPYIYMRLHGKHIWYTHNYSIDELNQIIRDINKQDAEEAYIYFNNNHDMLNNAKLLKNLITKTRT
jgi:uncharacterized protein YecE (DUF72 family)